MSEKKFRIPRKQKKKIPKDTFYCYTFDTERNKKEPIDGFWIKTCPYYEYKDGLEGYCSLLKCEIMDQVKECGQRYGI